MPTTSLIPHIERRTRVGVLQAHGELRTVTLEDFDAGAQILSLEGQVVASPTRHTIQIGWEQHLQVPDGTTFEVRIERYPWQFLNHSCQPNTRIVGRELVALRRIEALDELSFDYETTEWELAEPFPCRCGHCGGRAVRGFRHLSAAERARRAGWLAPHLAERRGDSLPS